LLLAAFANRGLRLRTELVWGSNDTVSVVAGGGGRTAVSDKRQRTCGARPPMRSVTAFSEQKSAMDESGLLLPASASGNGDE
jgi:hypothetical protein